MKIIRIRHLTLSPRLCKLTIAQLAWCVAALRGAGQVNFSIVPLSPMKRSRCPTPPASGTPTKMCSFDKAPEIIQAWHTVQTESLPKDLDIGDFNDYGYVRPYDTWFVVARYVHTAHADPSS